MNQPPIHTIEQDPSLKDRFGRRHNYLRISLTDRCNLRCVYCMPADGLQWTPKPHLMSADEVESIARAFVELGITKIRLTGGEPLVRKDVVQILEKLSKLTVELTITSNGVMVDQFIEPLRSAGVKSINISLDSLDPQKNKKITRRDHFEKVWSNIQLLLKEGFEVKVNVVAMRGVNEEEIIDFVELTREMPIDVRFIEFMPFDGNQWEKEKSISFGEIMNRIEAAFPRNSIETLTGKPNDTAKNYRLKRFKGSFGVISSVTHPFCDTCNRIRLTADGKVKNCLFSNDEADILSALRRGEDIEHLIRTAILEKKAVRAGMNTYTQLADPENHLKNRSMIAIGG